MYVAHGKHEAARELQDGAVVEGLAIKSQAHEKYKHCLEIQY